MSLNSLYHKIISTVTLSVMLWNLFGWLGAGLIVNHAHSMEAGDYCEVSFCSCSVEDGQEYCTCHHPELHHKHSEEGTETDSHHSDSDSNHGNNFCFYSSPHPVDNNPGEALLMFAKFNALIESQNFILLASVAETNARAQTHFIPSGFDSELLRPPRI